MASRVNVLNHIGRCKDCPLHKFQKPLLDNKIEADIFWVGLSAVKVECTEKESPLAENTNSGKLIAQIERLNNRAEFYKTNLVKCLPLDLEKGKIRYPKKSEMRSCCRHLESEITEFQPKLVFLLGKQVGDFLTEVKNMKLSDKYEYETFQKGDTIYVPVHHPSYILVYKRKYVDSYIRGISKVIDQFLSGELTANNASVSAA